MFSLIYSHSATSQFSKKSLLKETKKIMADLKIRVRDSLRKDGQLQIQVVDTDSMPQYKGATAIFARTKSWRVLDEHGDAVKYEHPIIYIVAFIDSLLHDKQKKSKFHEVYAKGVLVHELTHFLQKTVTKTYTARSQMSPQGYYSLQDEYEALTVHAYYFLKHFAPNVLKSIPKENVEPKIYHYELLKAMEVIIIQKRQEFNYQF
jgi:hypothetical protein